MEDETVAAMQAIAYDAEDVMASAQVIKRSFKNCGIAPFLTDQILAMAHENAGETGKNRDKKIIDTVKRAADALLSKPPIAAKVKRGKANVQANVLYLPMELILANVERKENEQKKKTERKKKRREAEEAKLERKAALTCSLEGCSKRSYKQGNAAGWSKCQTCGDIFCKNHKAEFNAHCIECKDDESTVTDDIIDGDKMVYV